MARATVGWNLTLLFEKGLKAGLLVSDLVTFKLT